MAADCISVPVVEHAQLRVHEGFSVKGSLCISPWHIQFVSLRMDIDDLRVRCWHVILCVRGLLPPAGPFLLGYWVEFLYTVVDNVLTQLYRAYAFTLLHLRPIMSHEMNLFSMVSAALSSTTVCVFHPLLFPCCTILLADFSHRCGWYWHCLKTWPSKWRHHLKTQGFSIVAFEYFPHQSVSGGCGIHHQTVKVGCAELLWLSWMTSCTVLCLKLLEGPTCWPFQCSAMQVHEQMCQSMVSSYHTVGPGL